MKTNVLIQSCIAVCCTAVVMFFAATASAEITVEKTDRGATVKIDGKLFTEYLVDCGGKPVLWPLIGPTGKPMTRGYPMEKAGPFEKEDHPHHRSVWFGHGDVNGIDFWGQTPNSGTVKHRKFLRIQCGETGLIVTQNDWVGPNGDVQCADIRTLRFGADGENRWIDFDILLRESVGRPIHFGDTKEGCFAIRLAGAMYVDAKQGGQIVNSRGQKDAEAWGKEAEWLDAHGPLDGKTVGIAIFNHPNSFRFPTYWHARTYGLIAANPLGLNDFTEGKKNGSLTLDFGEAVTLRYRLWLHRGDEREGKVAEAYAAYTKQRKSVREYLKKPPAWFATPEARQIAANILSRQGDTGGWPDQYDADVCFTGDRNSLGPRCYAGATDNELRFLARMVTATQDEVYRRAFNMGLDFVLKSQYPNGGWAQARPTCKDDHRGHITFNDNTMVLQMEFLREVLNPKKYSRNIPKAYDFMDADRRKDVGEAFQRGIDCILKCQIKVDGRLTAWCAQHDRETLQPLAGRKFEPASISGGESSDIVRLLMSIENPSPEVVQAVDAAVAWFEAVKITGIRIDTVPDTQRASGVNQVVVADSEAPPLWARFYEIGTNRPIFANRDAVVRYNLSELTNPGHYCWYGQWPARLLQYEYPAWKDKLSKQDKKPSPKK